MNSYFASVEQQANPFLRGRPLGVCAYLSPKAHLAYGGSENGCIIASSIEAKKVGVTTGMRVRDAKKLYPKILLVENEPAKYRATTERIFSILSDYTDCVEPYSIDEAFLYLTGWQKSPALAYNTAAEIRSRIKTEVGDWLKCSIGISYTRWLAKFASDVTGTDSTTILTQKDLEPTLKKHKLTDAWGINFRIERRLHALGLYTLADLKNYPVANLMQNFGKYGYFLWAHVNGIEADVSHSEQKAPPKSIGHSYCLPKKTTDRKYLRSVMMKLCEKAGRRLRKKRLEAQNVGAFLRFVQGGGMGQQLKVGSPMFDTKSIYMHADRILFSNPLPDKVRFLAVRVADLIPLQRQQSMFCDVMKIKNIAMACDMLNDKFGEFTVTSGQMWGMSKYAQDRVGYRMTVDVPERTEDTHLTFE